MSTENEKPLYLQPMTAGDARYAEGRRDGLAEASLLLARMAEAVADGVDVAGLTPDNRPTVVSAYVGASRALCDVVKAGEP